MARILAIDYGAKRVGLAVTDPMQIIATGLTTVHSKDVLAFLKDYLAKEEVECFVIGEPKGLNNRPTDSTKLVNSFIGQLKKAFPGMPVFGVDERFTSKMASQAILMSGVKKKGRQNKELIDTTSAVIILQSYMESRDQKSL
jgi:putative holliday junction resolvase